MKIILLKLKLLCKYFSCFSFFVYVTQGTLSLHVYSFRHLQLNYNFNTSYACSSYEHFQGILFNNKDNTSKNLAAKFNTTCRSGNSNKSQKKQEEKTSQMNVLFNYSSFLPLLNKMHWSMYTFYDVVFLLQVFSKPAPKEALRETLV